MFGAGFLNLLMKKDLSDAVGSSITFVQDNHSYSKKGVLRVLHYQKEQTQGKLFKVCYDAVLNVG
jgi:dTDP-4-dehydrorhamnose 3,5-epimerase